MKKLACIFPGQGSQSIGMGLDFYQTFSEARSIFEEIDRLSNRPLSRLCFEGPERELKRTVNTQPTILSVSLAAWQCYQALKGPMPDYVAGHSLGEFSALVACGSLTMSSAVHLVVKRANLMEQCPIGAMSAVIGLSPEVLSECCRQATSELADHGEVVGVANVNTKEQLVVSGHPGAVALVADKARAQGGKVIPLQVGGAFHSPLMMGAAHEFIEELNRYTFNAATTPVVQNYDAQPATGADEIKSKVMKQMPNPVLWCNSIEYMVSQGVGTFVEIGPGKALAGMVKRIDRTVQVFNIYDAATLRSTLEALGQAQPVS